MFLMGYARSPFRDFESYLEIVVCLDVDDVLLILKQSTSNFVIHEISQGIHSIKDISGYFRGCLHHGWSWRDTTN